MPSDCTKSWQVGKKVLSVYPSDPVSLTSNVPSAPRDGKHPFHDPRPLLSCMHKPPFEGSTLVPVLPSGTLHSSDLPMQTFPPSVTSTGCHYSFLIDFFKIVKFFQRTQMWMLPSCKTSLAMGEGNSELRLVSIQGFPDILDHNGINGDGKDKQSARQVGHSGKVCGTIEPTSEMQTGVFFFFF